MIFLFPENMILHPGGKWKMIFLKKIHANMIFSSNVLKRWSFQKVTWSFLYYLKRWYFFPKTWYFPWTENERRMTFLKKYTETWYFLFDMFHAHLRKKIKDDPIPQKIHLGVADIPDQHPRKGSINSLYVHGDLYRRFHTV